MLSYTEYVTSMSFRYLQKTRHIVAFNVAILGQLGNKYLKEKEKQGFDGKNRN